MSRSLAQVFKRILKSVSARFQPYAENMIKHPKEKNLDCLTKYVICYSIYITINKSRMMEIYKALQ